MAAMRSRLLDPERGMFQYRRLELIHATHLAPEGAAMEVSGEFLEVGSGTDGVDFDAAVIQIPGVTGEAELGGRALGEVAIPHALHAAAHEPAACV